MLDILKWIFESGWRFVGVLVLLVVVCDGLTNIARAFRPIRRSE